MTKPWAATIAINISLATVLIQEQFPDLVISHIEPLGEGWDNIVFKVNHAYVFRFPRREEGVTLIAHEIRVMPYLSDKFLIPISYPRFIGHPTDQYPYPFAGYDYLVGDAISDMDFSVLPKTQVLSQLAHFLRTIHGLALNDIPEMITEDVGRMDYEPRAPVIAEGLETLEQAGDRFDKAKLLLLVEHCKAAFPAKNDCIVHGDLYSRHILVKDHKISGIIDWGDMSLGCRAIDLSVIYSLYPPQYHASFWAIYGDVDEKIKAQALFRAIYSNVLMALYGRDVGNMTLHRAAIQGLAHCARNG